MSNGGPIQGDFPSGATMQPRYMGRVMNTYPVSESEMDHISSLNAQAMTRYSVATFLLGIGASIWINATFYKELTPEAVIATDYIAPLLLIFAVGFALGGCLAQYRRRSAWGKIKAESNPLQAVAPTKLVVQTIPAH